VTQRGRARGGRLRVSAGAGVSTARPRSRPARRSARRRCRRRGADAWLAAIDQCGQEGAGSARDHRLGRMSRKLTAAPCIPSRTPTMTIGPESKSVKHCAAAFRVRSAGLASRSKTSWPSHGALAELQLVASPRSGHVTVADPRSHACAVITRARSGSSVGHDLRAQAARRLAA